MVAAAVSNYAPVHPPARGLQREARLFPEFREEAGLGDADVRDGPAATGRRAKRPPERTLVL